MAADMQHTPCGGAGVWARAVYFFLSCIFIGWLEAGVGQGSPGVALIGRRAMVGTKGVDPMKMDDVHVNTTSPLEEKAGRP